MAPTHWRTAEPVPPISELTRIEPVYLNRLEKEGVFTTGILLEVAETPTRRQSLADHLGADTSDVLEWRDEALMLNLAAFGPDEHVLLAQARFTGLGAILSVDLATFQDRIRSAARELKTDAPSELTMTGWWEQARTLETPGEEEVAPSSDIAGAVLRTLIGIAVGAVGAAIATAFAPGDSALLAVLVVGGVMAATGIVGRFAAAGMAGFTGLVLGALLLLALLLGQTVLIGLPNTPFWQDQGLGFVLGLGAGVPAVIAGWVAGYLIGFVRGRQTRASTVGSGAA